MHKRELHIMKAVALTFSFVAAIGILGSLWAFEYGDGNFTWWQLIAFIAIFAACALLYMLCDVLEEYEDLEERTKDAYIKVPVKTYPIIPEDFKIVPRDKPCLNYRPTWESGVPDEDGKVQRFRFTEIAEEEGDNNV